MLANNTLKTIANAIAFQIVWFISVQGDNNAALMAVAVLLFLHQVLFKPRSEQWLLILIFSLVGYLGDSAIANFHLLYYPDSIKPLAPIWLFTLWIAFSTTLDHSLKWIFTTYSRTVLISLILVPCSYLAGINISNSQINNSIILLLLNEGFWWALLLTTYRRYSVYAEERNAKN
jgi:hypothetical protein